MDLHHTAVKEETGFSAVEMLLYLIAVTLITFVGYYVYHTQQAANKTYNAATAAAQIPAPKTTRKTTTAQSAVPSTTAGYYVIKDWGVKIKLAVADKVSFTVTNTPGQELDLHYESSADPLFTPESLVDKNCTPGVGLYRSKQYPNIPSQSLKKVGDYYYFAGGGPGACENAADNALKSSFLHDFQNLNIVQL